MEPRIFICENCQLEFRTLTGLATHQKVCKPEKEVITINESSDIEMINTIAGSYYEKNNEET